MPIDRTQRGTSEGVDRDVEVLHAEEGLLGVDDLGEDRRVHRDDDVVLRDDVLTVARDGDLTHVDELERVDEREDHDEAGLVGLAVLAESLQHADLTLLHDVHGRLQRGEQRQHDDGEDDQPSDCDGAE